MQKIRIKHFHEDFLTTDASDEHGWKTSRELFSEPRNPYFSSHRLDATSRELCFERQLNPMQTAKDKCAECGAELTRDAPEGVWRIASAHLV